MSSTIDERVVELKFDNKDFEANVKTSMNTLEYLKTKLDSLDGTKAGVEEINKSLKGMNFNGVAGNIETVASRFSALGLIGKGAMEAIGAEVVQLGKRLLSGLMSPLREIEQRGKQRALNIEQAKFQLEGLGMDVSAVMDDVNYAVDGTAYGLDEAARIASQFGASGVQAGEQMKGALLAVSGVAAMTNSEYSEIGQIFATVAGQGKLMTQQLRQLESRGLNAAAELAKQLGTTEENVRAMVTAGKISFEMFAEAMESAYGEHAKAANDTFEGSMRNMKAALGRIGADFYAPYLTNMRQSLHTLRNFIDRVRKEITKPFAEGVWTTALEQISHSFLMLDNLGITDRVVKGLSEAFQALLSIIKPITDAFSEMGFSLEHLWMPINSLSKWLVNTFSNMRMSGQAAQDLKDAVKGVAAVFQILGKILGAVINTILPTGATMNSLAGTFVHILGVIGRLLQGLNQVIDKSKVLEVISNAVRTALNSLVTVLLVAVGAIFRFGSYAADAVGKLRAFVSQSGLLEAVMNSKLGKGLNIVGNYIKKIVDVIKQAIDKFKEFREAGNSVSDSLKAGLYVVCTNIDKVLARFGTSITQISNEFRNFASVLGTIVGTGVVVFINGLSIAIRGLSSAVSTIVGFIKSFVSGLGQTKTEVSGISDSLETVNCSAEKSMSVLGAFVKFVKNSLSFIKDQLPTVIGQVSGSGQGSLSFSLDVVIQKLKEFMQNGGAAKILIVGLSVGILSIIANINKLIKSLSSAIFSFGNIEKAITSTIKSYARSKPSKMRDFANSIILIAGALWILAQVPVDKLDNVLIKVGAFMAVMILLSKIPDVGEGKLTGLSLGIIALAAGAYILVKAFQELDAIVLDDWKNVALKVGVLAALLLSLAATAAIVGKTAPKLSVGSFVILAFAKSMKEMVYALIMLDSVDWNDLGRSVGAMAILCLSLGAVIRSAGSLSIKSAIGFLAFIFEFKLLISAIKELTTGDLEYIASLGNTILDNIKAFGVLLLGFAAIAAIIYFSAGSFVKVGLALGIIAGSMLIFKVAIEKIGSIKDNVFDQGMRGIGALLIFIGLLMVASRATKDSKMLQFSAFLGVMTVCMVAMGLLMDYIGNLKPDVFNQGLLAMIALMAMVAVLVGVSAFTQNANVKAIVAMIVMMTVAFAEMALLTLIPYDSLLNAAKSMALVVGALAVLMYSFSKLQGVSGKIIWSAVLAGIVGMIAVGAALYLLSQYGGDGEKMKAAGIAIAAGMVGLGVALAAMKKLDSVILDKSVIFAIVAMSIPLVGLCLGMKLMANDIAKVPWQNIAASAVPMAGALIGLGLALRVMENLNGVEFDPSVLKAILYMCAPILAIGVALAFTTNVPWANILTATAPMTATLVALAFALDMLSPYANTKFDQSLLYAIMAMAVPIVAIGFSLALIVNVPWANILSATLPMAGVLIAMGTAMRIMSGIPKVETTVMAAMVIMAGQVVAIGFALSLVADVPWQNILSATLPMAAVLATMAACMKIISTIKEGVPVTVLIGMALMCAQIVAVGYSLSLVAQFDWQSIAAAAVAVVAVMVVMTGLYLAIATVASTGLGTAGTVVAMFAIVAIGAAIWLAGEGLSKLQEFDWADVGQTIVTIIAVFGVLTVLLAIIAVIGSTGVGTVGVIVAAAALVALGLALKLAGEGAQLAGQAFQMFVDAFQQLASTFVADTQQIMMGLTNLGMGIAMFITTVVAAIANGITMIATAIANGLITISTGIMVGLSNIGAGIGMGIANIFVTAITTLVAGIQDVIAMITGGGSDVDSEVQGVGTTVSTSLANFDWKAKAVEVAKDCIRGLIEGLKDAALNSSLFKAAAWLGNKVVEGIRSKDGIDAHSPGENPAEAGRDADAGLEKGIREGASGVYKAAKEVAGKVSTNMTEGFQNGKVMDALNNTFEKGKKKLEEYGFTAENLNSVVGNLTSGQFNLMESVTGLVGEDTALGGVMQQLTDAMNGTTEATNAYTASTGTATKAAKEAKDEITEMVEKLSEKIESSMDIFSEFKESEAISAEQMLKNMRSQVEGVQKWSVQISTLAAKGLDQGLIQKLADLGPQGADKVAAFASMTNEEILQANTLFAQSLALPDQAATYIVSSFSTLGDNITQGLVNGMDKEAANAAGMEIGEAVVDGANDGAGCHSPSVITQETGNNVVLGLTGAMASRYNQVYNVGGNVGRKAIGGLQAVNLPDLFRKVAVAAAEGFLKGLSDKESAIVDKAKEIGRKANEALKAAMDEHSPSKIWRYIGNMGGEGLVKGFEDYMSKVRHAAGDLGETANNSLNSSISKVLDAMGGDDQFVITPSLDLSVLTAQAQSIGSILNQQAMLQAGLTPAYAGVGADGNTTTGFTQNFYQYNTSPKALSQIDIYRQTKNLFTTAKGTNS